MDLDSFKASVDNDSEPPSSLNDELQALWHDAKGDWARAHELCQRAGSAEGDWVHAYLHRVEGDLPNASYWYRRSGQPKYEGTLESEWAMIATELLSRL